MKKSVSTFLLMSLLTFSAVADSSGESSKAKSKHRDVGMGYTAEVDSWDDFGDYMNLRTHNDQVEGLSYMVGGGVAGLVGIVGYQQSTDVVSRTVFALAQSAGILAVGYGANLYWSGNEYTSFYTAVNESNLTTAQKMDLLHRFLDKEREFRRTSKWIKVSTMLLSGAVNFYVASQERDKDVRRALQVFGAANLVIAFQMSY